jgi:hypothetical protein
MLRKTRKIVMLSKAHNKSLSHPSTHPSKNEGFAQDDHYFCAASGEAIPSGEASYR